MPNAKSLVARVHPYMQGAKARLILESEGVKGCLPDLSSPDAPVALEPVYTPLYQYENVLESGARRIAQPHIPYAANELLRLRLWQPSVTECDWLRSELVCKQLAWVRHPVAFEIWGNEKRVRTNFLCHIEDEPIVRAAVGGAFPQSQLMPITETANVLIEMAPRMTLLFHDYWPLPPYSALLTRPSELRLSPFETLLFVLSGIPRTCVAGYQVVFQPTHPNNHWNDNVAGLIDMDFTSKLFLTPQLQQTYGQQTPSGQMGSMAAEVLTKSHNDKPFFAAALRLLLVGHAPEQELRANFYALASFIRLYQHGGRALRYLCQNDYFQSGFSPHQIIEMVGRALTYRPGFLVNSGELVSLVHPPPLVPLASSNADIDALKSPRLPLEALSQGTLIGYLDYTDEKRPVCIPPELRRTHEHVLGGTGSGKSTFIENSFLEDIEQGYGLGILDPAGDLSERLLRLIPPSEAERVVLFDLSNPSILPLWNPVPHKPGQDYGRAANELVGALRSIMTGWGDRLEHILRHLIYGLLHVPGSTLFDVACLLTPSSPGRDQLCERIARLTDNDLSKRFFENDFKRYGKDDLGPPTNKLSKLLLSSDLLALVLSQPDNRFDFRGMMDAVPGKIFIANLSGVWAGIRDLLGSLFLKLFYLAAVSRSDIPVGQRRPFYLFVDEAQRFLNEAVGDLLVESRKFNLGLLLAHHFLGQLEPSQIEAVRQVGTTVILREDIDEAAALVGILGNKVRAEEIAELGTGEAFVRIGANIARIKTLPPRALPDHSARDEIVKRCHDKYYAAPDEIRQAIARHEAAQRGVSLVVPAPKVNSQQEKVYEFDVF